jgi:hypothetical protein
MNFADFYTRSSSANGTGRATGPSGPNQSIVTGNNVPITRDASGAPFAWLGMVFALVLLYLGIRFGAKLTAVSA